MRFANERIRLVVSRRTTFCVERTAIHNSQRATVFSDSKTDNDRASSTGSQASEASMTFGDTWNIPSEDAPSLLVLHGGFLAV